MEGLAKSRVGLSSKLTLRNWFEFEPSLRKNGNVNKLELKRGLISHADGLKFLRLMLTGSSDGGES